MIKLLLIVLGLFILSCGPATKELPDHVGDIEPDSTIDDFGFIPCNENYILQYYNFGQNIQYKGEKWALVNEINDRYKPVNTDDSGYITIRFVVNCDGKTGRFRLTVLDQDYKPHKMNTKITAQLMDIVKSTNGWKPGKLDGADFDYYQYLTFKIEKGEINSIIP